MTRILLLIPSRTYRTADFVEAASALDIEAVIGMEERPALADVMGGRWRRLRAERGGAGGRRRGQGGAPGAAGGGGLQHAPLPGGACRCRSGGRPVADV